MKCRSVFCQIVYDYYDIFNKLVFRLEEIKILHAKSQKKKCFVVIGPLFQHYTLLDIHFIILFLLFLLHAEVKHLLRFASSLYPTSLAFDSAYYLEKFVSVLSMPWVTISIALFAVSTDHEFGNWNNNKNPRDKTCKIEHLTVALSPNNLFHMGNTFLK